MPAPEDTVSPASSQPAGAGAASATRVEALVAGLGAPYGRERSLKLVPGAVLAERLLLSVHVFHLGPKPARALAEMTAALGMPEAFAAPVAAALGEAEVVHLGFEGGPDGALYKLYLERVRPVRAVLRGEAPGPVLAHLAFKWQPGAPRHRAVARYTCLPPAPPAMVLARIRRTCAGGGPLAPRVAAGLLRVAAPRLRGEGVMQLDVAEDDNPRRSFDLNVYPAGLRVADLAPVLAAAGRELGVGGALDGLLRRHAAEDLGHLAAGTSRGGKAFVSVYFGVEGRG